MYEVRQFHNIRQNKWTRYFDGIESKKNDEGDYVLPLYSFFLREIEML